MAVRSAKCFQDNSAVLPHARQCKPQASARQRTTDAAIFGWKHLGEGGHHVLGECMVVMTETCSLCGPAATSQWFNQDKLSS